jgi:hypothetical protein
MSSPVRSPDTVSDRLHPAVHLAAAGLLIWFVMAAWVLFGGAGYIGLALTMVSVLVFMAIAIPWALWRTSVRAAQRAAAAGEATESTEAADAAHATEPLGTWLRGRFATWTDEERGRLAAIEILLPLAAVAFGMTALGIVLELTRAGVV